MCISKKALLSLQFMINLGFRLKCFPFYVSQTKSGFRFKMGTKSNIFQWRFANCVYIMFKLFIPFGLGIYLEITDNTLQINERIQYYFVASVEIFAFSVMICVMLFSTNIFGVFDSFFVFEGKMSK